MSRRILATAIATVLIATAWLPPAQAQAPSEDRATFRLETNFGTRRAFSLVVRHGTATLDGAALSEAEVLRLRDELATAFSVVPASGPRTCARGSYEHVVVRRGKTRLERGCLEDPRAGALYESWLRLKEAAQDAY